jgi:hypothetical protein
LYYDDIPKRFGLQEDGENQDKNHISPIGRGRRRDKTYWWGFTNGKSELGFLFIE